MAILGDYHFGAALNGYQETPQSPLGTAYANQIDTRYDDLCMTPLLTAVDLSGSDAAGGGSVGTAATVRAAAFTHGINSPEKLLFARGTKLGAIRLDTRVSLFDGTAAGAGAPYGENVTHLEYTKNAAGTEEVSVCFDNTIYQVITDVPETGGYTASANNESHKYTIMGMAGSDAAASVICGLGRGSGTPQNKVASNTLSGTTTMDGSSWQTRATLGDDLVFTGFAMDGRFWAPHTNAGYYFLDGDGQRYRQQQDELPTDPNNNQGFGAQAFSFLGPGVLSPTIRGLRLIQVGSSRSVGVDLYPTNNTPVNGRYGHAGGSEKWIYMPIYNTLTTNSYICAVRPRQPGDQHSQELSWYVLYELAAKESKLCVSAGFKGSVTSPTIYLGRGSDASWFLEPLTKNPWDDSNISFSTSGTLYGTQQIAPPGKAFDLEKVTLETAACTTANYYAIDLVVTNAATGVEATVRCGAPVVSNGRKSLNIPYGQPVSAYYIKISATGAGSNATPRIKRKNVTVWGKTVDAA